MRKFAKPRTWKGLLGTGIKWIVVAEVAIFASSYALWRFMNSSQDFRYKVHKNLPYILESYYLMGETIGGLQTRQHDYEAWGIASKK